MEHPLGAFQYKCAPPRESEGLPFQSEMRLLQTADRSEAGFAEVEELLLPACTVVVHVLVSRDLSCVSSCCLISPGRTQHSPGSLCTVLPLLSGLGAQEVHLQPRFTLSHFAPNADGVNNNSLPLYFYFCKPFHSRCATCIKAKALVVWSCLMGNGWPASCGGEHPPIRDSGPA